jgi:ParB family chromosome partitioning protein
MTDVGQGDNRAGGRRRGLGMGLSSLLGAADPVLSAADDEPRRVPVEFLQPTALQPRRRFGADELATLAESIRAKGVMQPLVVRRRPDGGEGFEIVAGERRWRAAQMAGVHDLPIVIHELSDRETLEVAILENVQRQDLSPLEEAEGYRRLLDEFGHTQEALASTIGKSRSHIANLLRLLGLPASVRALLENGDLSAGHARALLGAANPVALGERVVRQGLNVRQTEALVRADGAATTRAATAPDADSRALERELSGRLGLPVTLKRRGIGGAITIAYRSLDQLDALIKRLS